MDKFRTGSFSSKTGGNVPLYVVFNELERVTWLSKQELLDSQFLYPLRKTLLLNSDTLLIDQLIH